MAKTVTLRLKGRVPVTHGRGPRVIEGSMSLGPVSEALHASDVELRSIHALFVENAYIGSYVLIRLTQPGTYGNYASFLHYNLGTTGAPVLRTAGSVTNRFLAVGE